MSGTERSPLQEMLCFDVYALNLAFGRIYKPLLEPLGVTYPQYLVLMILWHRRDMSVGQIGTHLGLDSSTLTPLLKRLEAAGLVSRRRDTADERRVIVSLTDAGRELRSEEKRIMRCVAEAAGITVEEKHAMQQTLRKLTDYLQSGGTA